MSHVKTKYEEARNDLQRFHECFYDDSKKNTAELKRKKIDKFITSCEKDVALNFRLLRDLGMVERERDLYKELAEINAIGIGQQLGLNERLRKNEIEKELEELGNGK